jgi:hypothetical protein
MALAIHFDKSIREGKVRDQTEIAELGHVPRVRVTQLMNLLHLAPDQQEQILLHPPAENGGDRFTAKHLRPIAAALCRRKQPRMWQEKRIAGRVVFRRRLVTSANVCLAAN